MSNAWRLPERELVHGTVHAWQNRKCRCEHCQRAHLERVEPSLPEHVSPLKPIPATLDLSWRDLARCKELGIPTAEFFPNIHRGPSVRAREACGSCVVRQECGEFGRKYASDGMFGGQTRGKVNR